MAYLELNELDQKKYGIPERIEFEYGQFGMRAVAEMERETGITYEQMEHGVFRGKLVRDADGNPVLVQSVDDDGEPELNDDGTPRMEEATRRDRMCTVALVWLILRCAGHKIPWDDFDVLGQGLRFGSGKDDAGTTTETD